MVELHDHSNRTFRPPALTVILSRRQGQGVDRQEKLRLCQRKTAGSRKDNFVPDFCGHGRAEGPAVLPAQGNKIVIALAAQEGVPVDDLYQLVENHPEYSAGDGVHYNAKGQTVEAAQVAQAIMDALAK